MSETAYAERAQTWVASFAAALRDRDVSALAALFLDDAYWRDLVAFTWDFGWVHGAGPIAEQFIAADKIELSGNWRIAPERTPPRLINRGGRDVVEAFVEFDTRIGPGSGIVRIDPVGPPRAWIFATRLIDMHEPPHLRQSGRPADVGYDRSSGKNWLDVRREGQDYSNRSPDVLVVGGGHNGILAAANLNRLGVDALVVDRFPRVGDNWRTRYHSLALHNLTEMVQLPYLPFPDNFPDYLPKDRIANWLEAYVDALEINYWTSTQFVGGTYDEQNQRWTARLERGGMPVELSPRHIIMATGGVGGAPRIPKLPGIDEFNGPVLHSSAFSGGGEFANMTVLVVGAGSSAHDIAQDLYLNGCRVTMLQRNPTSVVDLESANMSFPFYRDGTPLFEADHIAMAGFILPLMIENFRRLTAITNERDRELLDGLRRAGMTIDDGDYGAGWLLKFYQRGGGYYINVGCSELIINGSIKVLQAADVETFDAHGVRLRDGGRRDFDAVILATGYLDQQEEVRRLFGDVVAERVGKITGFDDDGELRNAWRPTAQKGLWFMVSGFAPARNYASLVAIQIRADLEGKARTPRRLLEHASASRPTEASALA